MGRTSHSPLQEPLLEDGAAGFSEPEDGRAGPSSRGSGRGRASQGIHSRVLARRSSDSMIGMFSAHSDTDTIGLHSPETRISGGVRNEKSFSGRVNQDHRTPDEDEGHNHQVHFEPDRSERDELNEYIRKVSAKAVARKLEQSHAQANRRRRPKRRALKGLDSGKRVCAMVIADSIQHADVLKTLQNWKPDFSWDASKLTPLVPVKFEYDCVCFPLGLKDGSLGRGMFVQPGHSLGSEPDDFESDILVFADGCVVFWNLDSFEEQSFLDCLFKECDEALEDPFPRKKVVTDLYSFSWVDGSEPMEIANDCIYLPYATTRQGRLLIKTAVSFGLVQSLSTDVLEDSVDSVMKRAKQIPKSLSEHGKVKLKRKAISQLMGDVLICRNNVHLQNTSLFDGNVPEFFWAGEREHLELPFFTTREYLAVNSRAEDLNRKIDVLKDLMDVLQSEVNGLHSEWLEWIVIVLIVIEVLTSVFEFVYQQFLTRNQDHF